jgi:hypothetical protein
MHPLREVLAHLPEGAAHIGLPNPHLSYQAIEDVVRLATTKLQLGILSLPGHDSSLVRDRPKFVAAIAECNAAPGPGHSHRVTGRQPSSPLLNILVAVRPAVGALGIMTLLFALLASVVLFLKIRTVTLN